ncbi:hypothetical protein DQ04_03761020 [Trypanosoma grayi]|uniref:hypothetical protein n=1 Tax=Trypanosoma grayi TaxID=71804 RepID=UPI0004F3FB0D|nr:hypothetical protein DQ04_03761020 [Trypanosoma grayi]KEG10393.1 hypothetical protein DQ04_03761020 [Trypanosoma grayi]
MGSGASSSKKAGKTNKKTGKKDDDDILAASGNADMTLVPGGKDAACSLFWRMGKHEICLLYVSPVREEEEKEEGAPQEPKEQETAKEVDEKQDGCEQQEQKPEEDGQHGQKKAEAPKPVQWTLYNDSQGRTLNVVVTFLSGLEKIRGLSEDVTTECTESGGVRATVHVGPRQTVPFVSGPIGGYLVKCLATKAE